MTDFDDNAWRRADTMEVAGPVAVIGDLHGRLDLLERLVARLDARHPTRRMPLFVVGDVVDDRGPDSNGVVEFLVGRAARGVRGNHEDSFALFSAGAVPVIGRWTADEERARVPVHPGVTARATFVVPVSCPRVCCDDEPPRACVLVGENVEAPVGAEAVVIASATRIGHDARREERVDVDGARPAVTASSHAGIRSLSGCAGRSSIVSSAIRSSAAHLER